MTNDDAPEEPGRTPNVPGDRLREVNEQLTLSAIRAQEEVERSAKLYQGLSDANVLLIKKQHQLRSLASQLTLVEQRERKHLATELHDYLAQLIVLGRLKIGQARRTLAPDDSTLAPLINDLDEIFTQTLSYTRTLMAELSPSVLQQFGLPTALTWLGDQMSRHGLTVKVSLPKESIRISGNHATLLYQSVRELLLNVVKHAATERALLTLSMPESGTLTLTVQDQGRGFDPASLEATTAAEHFGLFSVRERMVAMGGWLQMHSAVGQGTTVTLGLPLAGASQSDSTHEKSTTSPQARRSAGGDASDVRRVLLVDDHAMVRQGLRALLDSYSDVRVIGEAGSGLEAVAMAADLTPDVVIMDINMPQMDGIEATKLIKEAQPDAMIIGISVNNSAGAMQAMKRAGAATFLSKDAAAEQLHDAMFDDDSVG